MPTAREINEIHAEISDVFGDGDEADEQDETSDGERNMTEVKPMFRELGELLRMASDIADALSRTSAKQWMLTGGSSLQKHIRDARDHVNAARPAGVCPLCSGARCAKCFDTGWMNGTRLHHYRPSR